MSQRCHSRPVNVAADSWRMQTRAEMPVADDDQTEDTPADELLRVFEVQAREQAASSHELAGLLMDRCQDIETAMKRHIVRSDQSKKLEDLEGRTFGQLLGM